MSTVKLVILLLAFPVIFISLHCNKKATEPEPTKPNPPEFVLKSLDGAENETGIDAIPDGNGIALEWYPADQNIVEWIKIYKQSQNNPEFSFLASVESQDSMYVDYDINLETRYYYFLKSVDKTKVESLPSDTVAYKLLPKAGNLSHTDHPIPTFSWQYPYLSPVGYLVRLEDNQSAEIIWISSEIQSYELITMVVYNFDGRAKLDTLTSGRQYRWRVDVLGSDLFSGSESGWKLIERD